MTKKVIGWQITSLGAKFLGHEAIKKQTATSTKCLLRNPCNYWKEKQIFLFRMERSAEERTKYPDRINLDRRGLHGIPVLADEPGLRLLRCCNNFFWEISQLLRFLVLITLYPFTVFSTISSRESTI